MAVNLSKGERLSLVKSDGQPLANIAMGLGWDTHSGSPIDLDASCLVFDTNNRLIDTVWFRQLVSKDHNITHSGDNRTGDGDGDDETIAVRLANFTPDVKALIFTVNSFTGQNFSSIKNAKCRVYDTANNAELCSYTLSDSPEFKTATATILAKFYRHGDTWKIQAIGHPAKGRTFNELLPAIHPYL